MAVQGSQNVGFIGFVRPVREACRKGLLDLARRCIDAQRPKLTDQFIMLTAVLTRLMTMLTPILRILLLVKQHVLAIDASLRLTDFYVSSLHRGREKGAFRSQRMNGRQKYAIADQSVKPCSRQTDHRRHLRHRQKGRPTNHRHNKKRNTTSNSNTDSLRRNRRKQRRKRIQRPTRKLGRAGCLSKCRGSRPCRAAR